MGSDEPIMTCVLESFSLIDGRQRVSHFHHSFDILVKDPDLSFQLRFQDLTSKSFAIIAYDNIAWEVVRYFKHGAN